jgi:hypothetical protein
MAEHSPAPWHTGTDEDGHIVYDTNADFVADVGQDDDAELEEANLHLVTATPKLLAACQRFVAWDEDPHSTEADAKALCQAMADAIAEATGQKGA